MGLYDQNQLAKLLAQYDPNTGLPYEQMTPMSDGSSPILPMDQMQRMGTQQQYQKPEPLPQNYVQMGNRKPIDLGPSRSAGPALDYSQAPVEFGGQKGYRVKGDPFTIVMPDGTKLSLGNDVEASRKRQMQDIAMQEAQHKLVGSGLENQLKQQTLSQGGRMPIPAGYRMTADGNMEPIPGGPADLKTQEKDKIKLAGATDVDSAVATLRDAYNRLEKGGGITSTEKGPLENAAAAGSASAVGQALGKTFGTQNQSARNDIAMTRPALLAALMKATGMSAKQMDSNAELKLWLSTATDPTLDVESNRRALDAIERKYIGGLSAAGGPAQQGQNPQDAQALAWANANPSDPRSAQIKAKLGVK